MSRGGGVLCPPGGVTVWANVEFEGKPRSASSPHVPVWPSGSSGLRICFKDAVPSVVCTVCVLVLGAKERCPTERTAGHSRPTPGARGPTGWTPLGLAGAASTGASPPREGGGVPGEGGGPPTCAGLSGLSVEQKLSGSHKALVEMQDVVAELLKTVSWEYPATKVRGWGPALGPASSLSSP